MREILFRGKPLGKIDEDFVYGSLGVISTDLVAIYQCKEFVEDDITLVDIGTVGQYTGLTDKNGTRIFEGDIIEIPSYTSKGVVKFGLHKIACCGCCYDSHQTVGYFVDFGCRIESDEMFWELLEIIGNIHDNPELLKSEVQGE